MAADTGFKGAATTCCYATQLKKDFGSLACKRGYTQTQTQPASTIERSPHLLRASHEARQSTDQRFEP